MERFYWLKLKKDFFKRNDIKIIEAMPNGKDYIVFYLKLLCESVDSEGRLRYTETIPYSTDMLAAITNTNPDVVRSAIQIFSELKMMEILDDGTLFMTEVERLTGSETEWAERKRAYRERLKGLPEIGGQNEDINRTMSDKRIRDKSIEEEKELKEKELKAEFVSVWKEYPRKEGKVNAERDYIKARKEGVEMETILEGIRRYKEVLKANKTETQYTMQGSTWFHQRRWTDEYTKTSSPKAGEERDYDSTVYEAIYEEVYK